MGEPARKPSIALREVLSRTDISCLHVDDHGFVWFCTPDGIVRFDGRNQVEIARQRGLRAFARTYDGRLWTGGPAGLFELWREAPAGTNPLVPIPGTTGMAVNALLGIPSGALAVATDTGVMQITARTLTPLVMNGSTLKGIAEPVRVIFNITPHRFAAGTSNGVYLLLEDGRTVHLTTADGLPDNEIEAFTQGMGVGPYPPLWVGTKRGIAIIDWHGLELGTAKTVSTLPSTDQMSGVEIRALQAYQTSIWVVTPAGIYLRDSARVDRPHYDRVDTSGVFRGFAGYAGDFFVSTDSGVQLARTGGRGGGVVITSVRVDGVAQFAQPQGAKQAHIALTRAAHLVEIEFVSTSIEYTLRSMRDVLVAGSFGYAVKVGRLQRPDDVFSDIPPPEPRSHVEEVSSSGGPAPIRGSILLPLPGPSAQVFRKPIAQREPIGPVVVRRSPDKGPPGAFASPYALTADATGWLELPNGAQNRIVIEDPSQTLDAGLYRLAVFAGERYRGGGDSAVVMFTVMPTVWRQWWFVAPLALVAVVAILGVRWQRRRARRNIAQLQTRIAADLHDSVGASLSRIALLSDVVQQQVAGQLPAAAQSVHAIGDSARTVIDEMNDAVWFINPDVRNVRQMLVRVRTVATLLYEADRIQWTVDAAENTLDVQLSSAERRHLYLLIKEALTNARRHAQPTHVTVRLTMAKPGLRIEIEDDGVPPASQVATNGGNGVRNMHTRASELGGTLTIEPRDPAPGTLVRLQTPLR